MPKKELTKQIIVNGMTCSGCEVKIERKLKTLKGIKKVKASYAKNTVVVSFNQNVIKLSKIIQVITDLDYEVIDKNMMAMERPFKLYQLGIIGIVILGVFAILNHFGLLSFFNVFPEAKTGMNLATIFVIGLLTSVHCVGMCGGICLSQCVNPANWDMDEKVQKKSERMRPSLLYNLGRMTSYTIIGGVVGILGLVISFNGVMRGIVAFLAGIFMVIMGLNMLNIFPWLKKINIRMPKIIVGKNNHNSPFFVGLLNGFMPCGPLQAMQLYALSTGSFLLGAISMFTFALGTTPLLFGFGAISSLLSKKFTAKLMAISAVLVIILGLGMFNTGLSQAGFLGFGVEQSEVKDFNPIMVDGYQVVKIEVSPNAYAPIIVKKGVPVQFDLYATESNLNGCNNAIRIPQFNIQKELQVGHNIVEFTPTETGVFPYTCWMNMIKSSITVVE